MNEQIKQRINQLNNGEVPSGYEKTEIGTFPVGWKTTTLDKLLEFKNGVNADKEKYNSGVKMISVVENFVNINLAIRRDSYIYSMSETYESNPLWAFYANNNQGFCIEYDFNKAKGFDMQAVIFGLEEDKRQSLKRLDEEFVSLKAVKAGQNSPKAMKMLVESVGCVQKDTAKEILDEVSKHFGGKWLVELYKKYGLEWSVEVE